MYCPGTAGMRALITVDPTEETAAAAATEAAALAAATATKRYFIAADEVQWNFAPLGKDGCTAEAFGWVPAAARILGRA